MSLTSYRAAPPRVMFRKAQMRPRRVGGYRLSRQTCPPPRKSPDFKGLDRFRTLLPPALDCPRRGGGHMFIGHYGPGFAAKAAVRAVPLWVLFVAVQFLDFVWAALVLLGVEKVRI